MADHITIGDTAPRIQYLASGTDIAFTFPFAVFREEDVAVYLGVAEQFDGFTVLGAGTSEGGTVMFDTAPPSGTVVTLRRRQALGRVTDFQENGELRASALNDELDAQAAGLQQVADDVSRAIQFDPTDTAPSPVLPPRTARAGHLVGFDAAGALALYPALGGEASGTVQVPAAGAVPRAISDKLADTVTVRDFGAAGDGTTDDRAAIQAAFDAAALAGRIAVIPEGDFAVSGPLTLPAAAAGLIMRGRIVYAAGAATTTLTLGSGTTGTVQGRRYEGIRVVRAQQSTWASENDIGVLVRTPVDCTIGIVEAAGFTIGVRILSEGGAATGSTLALGRIANCRIGLDIRSGTSGGTIAGLRASGGRFAVAAGVNDGTDRFGIRLSATASGSRAHGGLVFDAPSFALAGTGTAIPFLVEVDGRGLVARDIRIEGNGAVVARHAGAAEDHLYEVAAAGNPGPLVAEYTASASRAGAAVVGRQAAAPALALARTVASVPSLRAAAFRWAQGQTGFDQLACIDATAPPPTTLRDAARPGLDGFALGQRGVSLGIGRGVGFAVDTRGCRTFALAVDAEAVRLVVFCFDAAGALLTDAAGTVVRASTETMTFDAMRGWWTGAGDMSEAARTALPAIRLAPSVASALIGVVRGGAETELRALRLTCDARRVPPLLAGLPELPHGRRELLVEATWDPPSLAANASAVLTVTVPGAAIGDMVSAAFTLASPNILLFGSVTAPDTVTAVAWNRSATATDLAGGTLRLRVVKT